VLRNTPSAKPKIYDEECIIFNNFSGSKAVTMIELENGQFHIGGIAITDLCKEFDTPLYVYDSAVMERQYRRLEAAFQNHSLKIKFACKALNNLSVLKFLRSLGSGLDTVSIQEVWLGLKAGFSPEEIIYTPNGVSLDEIQMAVEAGVQINIDNLSVLEQF
jgi:diaminopimelate decarboxylase